MGAGYRGNVSVALVADNSACVEVAQLRQYPSNAPERDYVTARDPQLGRHWSSIHARGLTVARFLNCNLRVGSTGDLATKFEFNRRVPLGPGS